MRVLQWDVVLLMDGGGCMERSTRFFRALDTLSTILSKFSNARTLLALYVDNGVLPFCTGLGRECLDYIGSLRVVGGRGCWDRGLVEASRLLATTRAYAIVIGCCSLPCDSGVAWQRLYDRLYYFCVERCPARLARLLGEQGFHRVACTPEELIEALGV